MSLSGFHLQVAAIVAEASRSEGFALGGGYALQEHIPEASRPSEDIDMYTNIIDRDVFDRAESAVVDALRRNGYAALCLSPSFRYPPSRVPIMYLFHRAS